MTDKNTSRRKLLKSIAAGSGAVVAGKSLPESWRKPVVDSVVLPAHAETSPTCSECQDGYCYDFTLGNPSPPVYMEIHVNGQAITVYLDSPAGQATGSGTADCGAFTISATGGNNPSLVVNGEIANDCSQVTGTLTIDLEDAEDAEVVPFTAGTNCV